MQLPDPWKKEQLPGCSCICSNGASFSPHCCGLALIWHWVDAVFLATCGNRIHATISPEQCEGEKWHFLTPVLGTWPSFVLDSHFSKRGRHPTTFCLPKVFLLDFMFSSRIHQLLSRFCSLSRGKSKELLLVFDLVDNLKLVLFGIPAFMLTKMKLNLQVSFFFLSLCNEKN